MTFKVLVADDDLNIIISLKFLLEAEQYQLTSVTTPEALLDQLKKQQLDCVLLDMNFQRDTTSGKEGLALIHAIRTIDPLIPIIMMTGWATVDLAVQALTTGANDFLQKPWDDDRLLNAVATQIQLSRTQLQLQKVTQENKILKHQLSPNNTDFSSQSKAMQQCLAELNQLAQSDMNILLTGENGTGKSMLAELIHQQSARSAASLVSVNMGAISESLFESEMFGHVKGAFTDAKEQRIGRFEMAQGGSLFLDEIANIPLSQQAKLLRVLEAQQFEKVGSSKTQFADVRIISATNANLQHAIQEGHFRQDLFYRLNTVAIHIPALRERQEDIIALAEGFLAQFCAKYQKPLLTLSIEAKHQLLHYSWPGNIRELRHCMERLIFTCQHRNISADQLQLHEAASPSQIIESTLANQAADKLMTLDEIEKSTLSTRLAYFKGNVGQAAKSLGLSRSGWYRRVDKFEL